MKEGNFEKDMIILDPKRRRVEHGNNMEQVNEEIVNGHIEKDGSKNVPKAGPVCARLHQ